MSVKVSSWVWHGEECADLVGNELVLMLALSDIAGDEGRCRYMDDETGLTYAALAAKVRVDRRTIERLIPKLRDRGLLVQSKGAKGRPNEFTLLVPWAKTSTDRLSVNGESVDADSPTAVQDSPTPASTFTDTSGIDTSLIRINVLNVKESDVKTSNASHEFSPDVISLCDELAERVKANGYRNVKVNRSWLLAADRLLRLDGFTADQIRAVAKWATADEFWLMNIQSMPTLRKHFDRLRIGRNKELAARAGKPSPMEATKSILEIGARLQAEADESRSLAVAR